MWDAVKKVCALRAVPARQFNATAPSAGTLSASAIERIVGVVGATNNGVVKVSIPRQGSMRGIAVGGSMGLSSWAAFSGGDESAAVDGDMIMTAAEVQPTLRALRAAGIHVVSLHNHMIGEEPAFYFTHFWGTGPAADLARGFKSALDSLNR